jgi:hypothetical protein
MTKRAEDGPFWSFRHRWRIYNTKVSYQRSETASTTHSAVMLTMLRTVAAGVRMCTGAAQPSRIGPMAMPLPAAV